MPSIAIGMLWPASAFGLPPTNLPMRGPSTSAPARAGETTHGVDHARAGEVDVAEAEVQAVAELAEPAAAPGPRTEDRVVERAAEQAPADERLPLPALGHGPGGDRGRGVHEGDHVEEERHRGRAVRAAAQPETALAPEEHPVPAATEVDQAVVDIGEFRPEDREAVAAEHERVADDEEPDEPESEDREVRAHHVGGVLRPAEPGLDQGEPGLHEDHQDRADDDPQQVEAQADRCCRRTQLPADRGRWVVRERGTAIAATSAKVRTTRVITVRLVSFTPPSSVPGRSRNGYGRPEGPVALAGGHARNEAFR